MSNLTRDGTAEPVSRDRLLRHEHADREIFIFPVQLTTSRVGNLTRLNRSGLKVAVNTVWILSKNCMFFWVFRFAKNTNFLLKGGIHFFYMRIFRVQFRFSQVPRLVKFLDRIYLVQTSAQSNAHAQLCYQGLCQPPQYL